jgi:hypothetical protein
VDGLVAGHGGGEDEALFLAAGQGQGVAAREARQTETGQQLVGVHLFPFRAPQAQGDLSAHRLGEELAVDVLHDDVARGRPLARPHGEAVQGDA